MKSGLKS